MNKSLLLASLFFSSAYSYVPVSSIQRNLVTVGKKATHLYHYLRTLNKAEFLSVSSLAGQRLTDLELLDDPNGICVTYRFFESLLEHVGRKEDKQQSFQ